MITCIVINKDTVKIKSHCIGYEKKKNVIYCMIFNIKC